MENVGVWEERGTRDTPAPRVTLVTPNSRFAPISFLFQTPELVVLVVDDQGLALRLPYIAGRR